MQLYAQVLLILNSSETHPLLYTPSCSPLSRIRPGSLCSQTTATAKQTAWPSFPPFLVHSPHSSQETIGACLGLPRARRKAKTWPRRGLLREAAGEGARRLQTTRQGWHLQKERGRTRGPCRVGLQLQHHPKRVPAKLTLWREKGS